jgi:Peptidase_C39 like family
VATDLFVAASGFNDTVLTSVVPPACRRPITAPASVREMGQNQKMGQDQKSRNAREDGGGEVLVTLPPLTPRCAAVHLLPSFSALTDAPRTFRFELSVRGEGAWSPWVAAAPVGSAPFDPLPAAAPGLTCDVDEFTASSPVDGVRLRLRASGGALAAPWLIALSASDGRPPALQREGNGVRLVVPAISQVALGGPDAMRICSPASVAMVLGYWGRDVPALSLAAEIFDAALDRYGVWPAAIAAAARHGVAGYLLRFPDWTSAAWCLERGMPIIASVRYAAGELTGAAIAETTGHLLVLTGYEGEWALVNDPVGADAGSVPKRYPLRELQRVWLERTGVGYVLFPPAGPGG